MFERKYSQQQLSSILNVIFFVLPFEPWSFGRISSGNKKIFFLQEFQGGGNPLDRKGRDRHRCTLLNYLKCQKYDWLVGTTRQPLTW